VQFAAYET